MATPFDPYADVRDRWQQVIEEQARTAPTVRPSSETIRRLKQVAREFRDRQRATDAA